MYPTLITQGTCQELLYLKSKYARQFADDGEPVDAVVVDLIIPGGIDDKEVIQK